MRLEIPELVSWEFAIITAALFCLAGGSAWAQESSSPGAAVSLGDVSGTAKGQVTVPLMLKLLPTGTQIGSIETTVTFESRVVSFVRAEKGFLLDGVGGAIEAQQTNDPDKPNRFHLRVQVVTQGQPRKSLPEGLILALIFDVKPEASAGTLVPLKFEKVSVTDLGTPPKALHGSVEKNGSIEVVLPEDIPVMPCFFFSH